MKASTSSSTVAVNAVPPAAAGPVRSSRIAPHSHIKGLGLTPEGYVSGDAAGFVGQELAREVCTVIHETKFDLNAVFLGLWSGC
jgi:RuvB-like protein 1